MAKPLTWGPKRSGYYEVVRGANVVQEDAFKSKKDSSTDSGVEEFNEGELAIIDANGFAAKSGAAANVSAFHNIVGSERSDAYGAKGVALALGAGFWVETDAFDLASHTVDNYAIDTELCVKSGKYEPALAGEPILAIVKRAPLASQSTASKALQKSAVTTLLVEFGPRGHKA